jgi:anti-anti-sigma regulatory factor
MASKHKSESRIGMPADLRIAAVDELRTTLRDALGAPQIVLDAAAVERVDTAALQLLVAFQRAAKQHARQVRWTGVSAPLEEAASQLGLAEALALPAHQPA